MKIAIIHSVSGISAKQLRIALEEDGHKVKVSKPHEDGNIHFDGFDYVLSLGCSVETRGEKVRLNKPVPVKQCVDKRLTFASLNRAGCSTVEWTTKYEKIPKHWDQVVVRKDASGRKGEDIDFLFQDGSNGIIPKDAQLYTKCHYGRYEYRIVVFNGKVTGRYYKKLDPTDGGSHLMIQKPQGFKMMDEECIKAAKALGIDYVGFDVKAHSKNDFVILEANSGAMMLDETIDAMKEFFRK